MEVTTKKERRMKMKKMCRLTQAAVVLLTVVLLLACTHKQLDLKPEQEKDRAYYEQVYTHATATQKFAEAAMKYNLHYKAADPETQAFLKKEVDPLWIQASDALDVWEVAIKGGKSGEDEIMAYKRLKTQILLKLPDLLWSD